MTDHVSPSVVSLSFEKAMQELDTLVTGMEEGSHSLEAAISVYERGTALKKHCEDKLRQAKLRVDQITVDETGDVTLSPFDSESK